MDSNLDHSLDIKKNTFPENLSFRGAVYRPKTQKMCFSQKIHISPSLSPIDLKFGVELDIIKIYRQKFFGAKFEFLEPK